MSTCERVPVRNRIEEKVLSVIIDAHLDSGEEPHQYKFEKFDLEEFAKEKIFTYASNEETKDPNREILYKYYNTALGKSEEEALGVKKQ